jgi:hypothetical protein
MRFISQFWNGSKAIARGAGSNDLQLFDLKEKETTEAAVAFDADLDIARAVIFNAGGEFSWQVLAQGLELDADLTAFFKLRADRSKRFAIHVALLK